MKSILRSLAVSAWFMFLTFPLMVIKVNTIENTIRWRWMNLVYIGLGSFILSFVWRYLQARRGRKSSTMKKAVVRSTLTGRILEDKRLAIPFFVALAAAVVLLPQLLSFYQTNILVNFMICVVLGLGLDRKSVV